MLLRKKLRQGETEAQIIANLPENNNHIADYILAHNGQLPPQPMFEKHPYEYTEFNLGYDKMIIGTFPPISYIYDNTILAENGIDQEKRPLVPFFHGNRASMWNVLLIGDCFEEILMMDRSLRRNELIDELIYRFIRYDDIIKFTRREKTGDRYTAEDKKLFNITPNFSLVKDVLEKKELDAILFNTSTTFSKNIKINKNNKINIEKDSNIKSFDLFIRTIQDLGYKVEFRLENSDFEVLLDWIEVSYQNSNLIQSNFSHKIIFKIRISNFAKIVKEFYAVTPFSPAARGRVDLNPIVSLWLNNNLQKNRFDLLKNIYQSFSLFSFEEEYSEYKNFLFSLNHYQ
jgi:hypothetical protein